MNTFNPHTKAESAKVNENFTELSTGQGDVDNNKLLLYRADTTADFVKSGLVWSLVSGLNGTMTVGVAYVQDVTGLMQRLSVATITSRTFTASKDTYVDLGSDGIIYYIEVANGAIVGMTLTAGRTRIAKVITSGVTITSVVQTSLDPLGNYIRNLSPIRITKEEAWIPVTYQNSWVDYDVTGFPPASYFKDSLGIVHFKGLMKSGTMGLTQFTLPVGYRPLRQLHIVTVSNSLFANIAVLANGNVVPQVGSNIWYSIDGISFRAEQ